MKKENCEPKHEKIRRRNGLGYALSALAAGVVGAAALSYAMAEWLGPSSSELADNYKRVIEKNIELREFYKKGE